MKKMKILFILLTFGVFIFSSNSCKRCKNEDPRARIINNGTQKADVQVKTTNGNTININNIAPNTSSDYASYADGVVSFTINVSNESHEKEFNAVDCFDYDIVIDSQNNISVKPIDRN